jgi:hypothetical protein
MEPTGFDIVLGVDNADISMACLETETTLIVYEGNSIVPSHHTTSHHTYTKNHHVKKGNGT